MKKLYVLLIVMVAIVAITGCRTAPAPAQAQGNVPAWISEMPPEDAVWGIGTARLQNENLAMTTATSRATTAAARQIGTLVQGMLTDYANESGLAENPRSMIAIENIERSVVNMTITSTVNMRERMPDGTWWIRVSVRKADALGQVDSIVNNEMADFAEFRAERALQQLDFQLSNSRPEVNHD